MDSSSRGKSGRGLPHSKTCRRIASPAIFLFAFAFGAFAQTNPPPASYTRSYTNDVPNQPLVTVSVSGASNVACLTIEEIVPAAATVLSVSGDGVYLPARNAIRWGPYFNTIATNASYRLTGLSGSYPVNGGSWMDGHWYFSPAATMVAVLPLPGGGGGVPSPPPQVVTPTFSPPSGANVPTSVTISCATPSAAIYYTLDGSLPTQGSTPYTGAVPLASASVLRAAAFTNGWTPSVAAVAYYGPPAVPANAQVTRSVSGNASATPVVTFNVVPGTNANCIAITESLAPGLGAANVSSGGNYVASNNVVLWGPFFGTNVLSLSYQAVGLPGVYPAKASWSVDGVSGTETTGTNIVIIASGGSVVFPTPPPQVPAPIIIPLSGSAVPVDVLMGLPGWDFGLLDDTWAGGTRSVQNLPTQSAWFVSGSSTNLTAGVSALNFWNGTNAVTGITYFTPNATTPVSLGVGDTLKATLKLVLTGVAPTNTAQGLRIGLFDFVDSALSPPQVSADGFTAAGQGNGVQGYCLFQNMGTAFQVMTPVDIRVRTNLVSCSLLATNTDFRSMSGSVVSNNFPGFTAGRQYILTLTVSRTAASSLAFNASWLDTTTGGTFSNSATNSSATSFRFDGLALWSQTAATAATNITLNEFKMDYIPQAASSAPAQTNTAIYYTLDGSLPTPSSMVYTGAVQLASAGVVRAIAFAAGWTPSGVVVAYYVPPAVPANAQVTRSVSGNGFATPVVTFNVTPGTNASCIAITEALVPGLGATSVSSGGNYVASNNVVLWGPFFGTNVLSLSYQAVGLPGVYPVRASWSVDGVSGTETTGTNLVIAGTGVNGQVPTPPAPPPQVATPVLTPPMASNLPVSVTITDATPGAVIYYTLDGSLPTKNSTLCTGVVSLVAKSVLRAVAFTNGWTPSVAAVGEYVPVLTTNTVLVTNSITENATIQPIVSLTATPQGAVNCYAVVETIPFGLTPSGLSGDGIWDPIAGAIRWGPYLDNQPRGFSFSVSGASGTYLLSGQVSVNGYSMSTGATNIQVNTSVSWTAPQIGTQPSSQVALAGSTVQFTVSASGSSPLIYRWYFNTNTPLFSPSTVATLSLSNVTAQSAGHYSVVITNVYGNVTSSIVSLTVVTPLVVTGINLDASGNVTLNFASLPNSTNRIWAATNLVPPAVWQVISTNIADPNGQWQFIDTNAIGHPMRYYRFSMP
jgi:hypothetical protein